MPAAAVGAVATAIGSYFAASVIVYAAIGAVIGGLTAAVMGGDIGKGILFGAIGGAVCGGISGALGSMGSSTVAGTTGSGAATGIEASSYATSSVAHAAEVGAATESMVGSTGGGALSGLGSMSQGTGLAVSALINTAGPAIAGAFDNSAELAAAEKEKDRKLQMDLAKLQADTAIKTASMRSGGGSSSDHYAADMQLLNAREQRAQDYKMKQEEYALIEERRQRQADAVSGVTIANPVEGTYQGQGILAPKATNPEYAANGTAQPTTSSESQGILQPPPNQDEVA